MKVKIDNKIMEFQSIWLDEKGIVKVIDQRKLPFLFEIFEIKSLQDIVYAINDMIVRGAPLIGITAAYGLFLCSNQFTGNSTEKFIEEIDIAAKALLKTRPTAVDMFNIIKKIKSVIKANVSVKENQQMIRKTVEELKISIINECKAIGEFGIKLFTKKITNVMTICNAGALATVDIGTALAPIRKAKEKGKKIIVYVNETRPKLQGARLTAWELYNEDIEYFIITDNAAGYLIKNGKIDLVIVGADRIVLNGDVANKIGTYTLSLLCKEHKIPFYVAAPLSTFDFKTKTGNDIIIEERNNSEVRTAWSIDSDGDVNPKNRFIHHPFYPNLNPAFDVTPVDNIDGIITSKGILYKPLEKAIKKIQY